MAAETTSREQEIKTIWKDYAFFYRVLGGVALVGIGVLIGMIWFASEVDRAAYLVNLYTSLLSVVVAVFVIDLLNRRRDVRRAVKDLQEQLVRDASSTSNEVAKNAVHQLRKRGWLEGESGLLKGENLEMASLEGAMLSGANMSNAKLGSASLKDAILYRANLEGANLIRASLRGSSLTMANLNRANLQHARLEGASLVAIQLEGANLRNAQLEGSKLLKNYPASLNEKTILPDGSYWTPEIDLTKFGVVFED